MRVALISGGRSDRGQLRVVYDEMKASDVDAWWVDLTHCQPVAEGGPAACAIRTAAATRETVAELVSLQPDWVMVLGDRYEILGATVGAYVAGFPIAHLSGGDLTEGSQDDCMRHAITKLAHIHFPDNEDSGSRLIQLGEQPDRIHVVGCPEIDRIMRAELLSRDDTFRALGWDDTPPRKALLACLHPETIGDTGQTLESLYEALSGLGKDIGLVLVGPNQDAGCEGIKEHWQTLEGERFNTVYRDELPEQVYLSLMKHCDAMVGNSSAGIYEAPAFSTPAVNIGDRQTGRMKTASVLDCSPDASAIRGCINYVLTGVVPFSTNPYGDGQASKRITHILKSIEDPNSYLRKRFYCGDISGANYPHLAIS